MVVAPSSRTTYHQCGRAGSRCLTFLPALKILSHGFGPVRGWPVGGGLLTVRPRSPVALRAFAGARGTPFPVLGPLSLRWAGRGAGPAYMEGAGGKEFGGLGSGVTAIASLVHVLATSSSIADSNERTESG